MWQGVKGTSIGSIFAPFTQQKLLEVSGKEEQWSSQTLNSMLLTLRDVTSAKHSIEEQEPDSRTGSHAMVKDAHLESWEQSFQSIAGRQKEGVEVP